MLIFPCISCKNEAYLERLWVCAVQGDVGGAGDDEEACHPLGEEGRGEAWGRKGEPWRGAGRQGVEGEEGGEEGETG